MINSEQMRLMNEGADQAYWMLFLLALLLCWFLYLGTRSVRLRALFTAIHIPLPYLPLAAILGLAFILRIPHLSDSLWYDEAFTARIASLSIEQLPSAIVGDIHPPLWYLIEWLTVRVLGSSEIALRIPALVFGLLLIVLVYRLALSLHLDERTALLSALTVAVLPAAIYYSNEARGYALLACLALAMVIAIQEDRPVLFAASGGLICLTHNLGYFYLAVLGVFALWQHRNQLCWPAAFLIAGMGTFFWLPYLLRQSQEISDGFWIQNFGVGSALRVIGDMTVFRSLPEWTVIPILLVVFVLTVMSIGFARRWLVDEGLPLLMLVLGVPGAIGLASLLWHPVYLARALLPCGLALSILWAYLLTHANLGGLARAITFPALGLALICFYLPGLGRADIRSFVKSCDWVTGAYATSIPAAMFASYYIDAPLLNWAESGDLNQSLTPEAKSAFGLVNGEVDDFSGDVCLLALETPMTTQEERNHVASLVAQYPHTTESRVLNVLYQVNVYRLHVGQERVGK